MPTHRDKPEGFDQVARRRTDETEDAVERARRERALDWSGRVQAEEEARRQTSVPPPPRRG